MNILKRLFSKEKEENYVIHFFSFGKENEAIRYEMRGKYSEVKKKVQALKDFINFCTKRGYQNGIYKIEDCHECHFWIDNGYPSFKEICSDAKITNKVFKSDIEKHEAQFKEWVKND